MCSVLGESGRDGKLVLHWTFDHLVDGFVRDVTSWGNHGALFRGTVSARSVILRGDGDNVSLHLVAGTERAEALTLAMWIRLLAGGSKRQVLFSLDLPKCGASLVVYGRWSDSRVAIVVRHSGRRVGYLVPCTLRIGMWQHLALILRTGRINVYLDGKDVRCFFAPGVKAGLVQNLVLGKAGQPSSLEGGVHAQLGDFQIYTRALSEVEIRKMGKTLRARLVELCGVRGAKTIFSLILFALITAWLLSMAQASSVTEARRSGKKRRE